MNVWIINHYANVPDAGSSTRHYSLARELVKRGHQATIIAAGFHHWGQNTAQEAGFGGRMRRVKHGGVGYVFLPVSEYSGNGPGRIKNMLQFAWRAARFEPGSDEGRPDVVIGSSSHPPAAWAGLRLARRHRVPFVFEVRDLWPETLVDLGMIGDRHTAALAIRALVKHLHRQAALNIILLPFAHERVERYGVPREHILYLPNGVDLSDFSAERAPDRVPFTLMYFGAHGAPNGLNTMLDAAVELERKPASRPVVWRFVGEGTHKARLVKRAKELRLRSVSFEGRVPKSRIPSLASEADAFVVNLRDLPVYRYGISLNKIFDYLAARRPVIFASAARNDPIAEAGAGITVPPEDPSVMAGAVRHLVGLSREERDEMGARGRRYIEERHGYERLGESLERALKRVVEKRRIDC